MQIRDASEADLPAILEITNEAISSYDRHLELDPHHARGAARLAP